MFGRFGSGARQCARAAAVQIAKRPIGLGRAKFACALVVRHCSGRVGVAADHSLLLDGAQHKVRKRVAERGRLLDEGNATRSVFLTGKQALDQSVPVIAHALGVLEIGRCLVARKTWHAPRNE